MDCVVSRYFLSWIRFNRTFGDPMLVLTGPNACSSHYFMAAEWLKRKIGNNSHKIACKHLPSLSAYSYDVTSLTRMYC